MRQLRKSSATTSAGSIDSVYLVSFIQRPPPGAYRLSRRLSALARHSTTHGLGNTCPHTQFAPWSQMATPGHPRSPPSTRHGTLQHVPHCKVQGWSWRQSTLGAVFKAKLRRGGKAALTATRTVLGRSSILAITKGKPLQQHQREKGTSPAATVPLLKHTPDALPPPKAEMVLQSFLFRFHCLWGRTLGASSHLYCHHR